MAELRRSRSPVIVVVLVATLGMTAFLAYQAQQAARSHRETAENVLRDYAAFAAWEFGRLGRAELLSAMNRELQAVQQAFVRGDLDAALTHGGACGACGHGPHRLRSVFRVALPGSGLDASGAPLPAEVRTLIETTAAEARRNPAGFTCPGLALVRAPEGPAVVVWRPVPGRANLPTAMIGFVVEPTFVEQAFARVLREHPLLPPSLLPGDANWNDALAVRVTSPAGDELFSSAGEWSSYSAEERLQDDVGGLALAVALKPEAAGRLVIGGLPRERLPLFLGLLALTVGLVGVALVQLRREAELSRLRADFVSGVSHELRTPLAQIRMFTETLLLGRVRSHQEGRRSLEIIARESQRLAQLVENVLLFARGERRQPQVDRQAARLAPIVADVVESFAPLAAARQARIVTTLDERTAAKVDAGALRQILLNLLDNAVKHGPAGQTVAVALRLDGDCAVVTVDDEGPGVDARDADRIWQPFNRLAHSKATGGAGIGLAIVRQLVDLHGGRASVERGPAGARFTVRIPGAWTDAGASAVA